MLYRIQLSMSFDDYDEAHDFFDDIMNMIPKAEPQDGDYADWHKCYHDETHTLPCEIIKRWQPD